MANLPASPRQHSPTPSNRAHVLHIYISTHCANCAYAVELAQLIRAQFPAVVLCIIDIHQPGVQIPEAVFATPTYLLNGQLWSLGNPSSAKVQETFTA